MLSQSGCALHRYERMGASLVCLPGACVVVGGDHTDALDRPVEPRSRMTRSDSELDLSSKSSMLYTLPFDSQVPVTHPLKAQWYRSAPSDVTFTELMLPSPSLTLFPYDFRSHH